MGIFKKKIYMGLAQYVKYLGATSARHGIITKEEARDFKKKFKVMNASPKLSVQMLENIIKAKWIAIHDAHNAEEQNAALNADGSLFNGVQ